MLRLQSDSKTRQWVKKRRSHRLDKNFPAPPATNMNPRRPPCVAHVWAARHPHHASGTLPAEHDPRKQGTDHLPTRDKRGDFQSGSTTKPTATPGEEMERQLVATKRNSQAWQHCQASTTHKRSKNNNPPTHTTQFRN